MVQYWKLQKYGLTNKQEFTHLLILAKVLEIEDDVNFTVDDLNKKIMAARKQLKPIQNNAAAARDTHLEEFAQCRLKNNKGDLAAAIKNIQHCEELKLAFAQMKPITK
eukprot:2441527-Ditylum_brightwellii.AAC.1